VIAQQAPAKTEAAPATALEEVIVTAQKRAESLQDVPLAITAISGEDLKDLGIANIKSVSEHVPGFAMGQFNPGQPQMYIRGIGTNIRGAAEDPGVIVFVDEVYVSRAQGSDIDLNDLDRVEVLRGPQGTLFGRNVIGGAISLVTTKPGPDTRWGVQAGFGDYGKVFGNALVSGELADSFYGKVAVSYKRADSYLENHISNVPASSLPPNAPFDDRGLKGSSSESVRTQLRYNPSETVDANLTLYYSSQDDSGAVRHFVSGIANQPINYPATDALIVPGYADDYRNVLTDDAGYYRSTASGANLRFDVNLSDSLQFTSLTGYRYGTALEVEPGIGTAALAAVRLWTRNPDNSFATTLGVYGNLDYIDRNNMLTQEFRLASRDAGPLTWVAGLYYINDDTYRNETNSQAVSVRGATPGSTIAAVPQVIGGEEQWNKTTGYAAFGQATYRFNDQWALTAGARYTHDKKDFHGIGTRGGAGTVIENYDVSGDASWSATTPKATIEYKPTLDALLYASYSKGYKAGGFPNLAPSAAVASTAYEPEYAEMYEIGAKTEWFDGRLRLNLAAFDIKYKDMQVLLPLTPVNAPPGAAAQIFTLNAANSSSQGVELEFAVSPTVRWLFSGSASLMNAVYDEFFYPDGFVITPGQAANLQSQVGNYLRNAPRKSGTLLARYTQPLEGRGSLSFQMDTRFKDKVYSDPSNLEYAALPSYALTDFRVAYATASGNVEIAAIMSNAFDRQYMVHNYNASGLGLVIAGAPRMLMLTVSVKN
jgi:iron complex outermembrane receptor protein